MNDDRTRQALKEYIISLMQRKFDEYIDQVGRDAILQKEDGGVDRVYLKAFGPLVIDSTIDNLSDEFPKLTKDQIITVINELNDITQSDEPQRDENGQLEGFWIDLINVAKELYDGEHLRVDVYIDEGTEEVTFGIDNQEEIFEIALD